MGICFSRSKKKTKNKTNGELSGAPTPLATTNDKPPLESHAHTTDAQISLARNIPFINDASAIPASVESEKLTTLESNVNNTSPTSTIAQKSVNLINENEFKNIEKEKKIEAQNEPDIPGIVQDFRANKSEVKETPSLVTTSAVSSSLNTSQDELKKKALHLAQAFKESISNIASNTPLPTSIENVPVSTHQESIESGNSPIHSTLNIFKKRPTSSERCIASPRESLPNQTLDDSVVSPSSSKYTSSNNAAEFSFNIGNSNRETQIEPKNTFEVDNALQLGVQVPLPSSEPVLNSTSSLAPKDHPSSNDLGPSIFKSLGLHEDENLKNVSSHPLEQKNEGSNLLGKPEATTSSDNHEFNESENMSSREAYLKKLEGIISKNHHFASSKARETQKLPLTKPQSLEPLRDSPSNLPENNLHASLPSEISKYAILSSPPATEEAVTKNESVTASLPTHVQDKLMTVAVAQNEHDTHSNINPSHFKAQDFTLPVKSLPDSIDISTKKNEGSTQLLSSLTQTNIAPQLNNLVSSNDVHQKEIVLSSTSDHVPQTLSNVSTPKLVNNELNHSLPSTTSLTADKANGISLPVSSNVLNEKEKEKEKEKETKSSVSHFSEIISSDPIVDKNSSKEEKMLNSKEPTNFVKDPVHLVPQAHALLPEDRANEHIQSTSSFVIKKDNSISGNTQDDAENFVKPHSAASVLITEEETVPVKKVSLDKLTESKANSSHIVTSVETVGKKQHLKSVDQLIDESKNKTASSDLKHKSTTAITSITHLASRSTSNNVSSTSDVSAQKSKSKSKQGLMDTLFHKLKSSKPSLSKSNEPEAKTATIQESENITSKNTSIPDIDSQKVAPVIHENQGNKIKAEEVVKDLTADAALNEETGKKERGEDEEMKEIGEEEKDRRVEKENLKDVQETTSQILIDDLKRVISLNSNLTRSNEVTGMINGASENLVKITPITLTSSIDAKTTDSTSSISKAILTPLPTSPVTTSFPSVENTVELTTTTAAMTSSSPLSNLKKSSSMTKVKKVPSHTSVQSVHVSPIATHPKKKDGNHSEPILSSDQFTAKNGSVSKISPTSKQGPPTTTPITKSTPVLNKDSSLISLKATGSKENVRSRGKDGRKNKSHRKSK